jgi:hypothetical protein
MGRFGILPGCHTVQLRNFHVLKKTNSIVLKAVPMHFLYLLALVQLSYI